MADPIALTVLENAASALRAIATGAGYHYTVKSTSVVLDPIEILLVSPTECPFLVVHFAGPGKREFMPALRMKDELRLAVVGCVICDGPGGVVADPKMAAWANLAADIEKALTVDATRGGNAIDTRLDQPDEPMLGFGGQNRVIVVQPVRVILRRVYGQP